MIAVPVTASMKDAALEAMEAEAKARRNARQKAWVEQFNESAKALAEEIRIDPKDVALVLASIVAGQVPNFRCTFDDEL